jgi:DNA-directed RNA polymerase subunit RPC12/RpoP
MTSLCPHCGHDRFWGPGEIVVDDSVTHEYVTCRHCQQNVLVVDLVERDS